MNERRWNGSPIQDSLICAGGLALSFAVWVMFIKNPVEVLSIVVFTVAAIYVAGRVQ